MNKQHNKLLAILAKSYALPELNSIEEIHEFMRKKVSRQYRANAEFKIFLDDNTKFLPPATIPIQRWYYYLNSETKPHVCPACSKFIPDYYDKYCCHSCSTTVSTGAKRGPKIDLEQKEQSLIAALPKGYRLLSFGRKQSTFKHKCGNVFELGNRSLVEGTGTCSCLHKKIVVHTLESVQQRYRAKKSDWKPIAYDQESEQTTYLNKRCKHTIVATRDYVARCTVCKPKNATRVKTPKEYAAWVKANRPEYKLLDTYVDSKTPVSFRHVGCKGQFKATPSAVARRMFQCPCCSPKTCGSVKEYMIHGKAFHLRGKEAVAVQWILDNTSIRASSISFDVDKSVPKFSYRQGDGARTQTYLPDFYVENRNLIIEVKDCTTLGIRGHDFFYKTAEELWLTNCAKAKAVLAAGYKFQLLLFNKDNIRVVLPKDWHLYSHAKIKKWVRSKAVTNLVS